MDHSGPVDIVCDFHHLGSAGRYMRHKIINWIAALFVVLSLSCVAACKQGSQYPQIPPRPDPPRLVNDYAGVLTGKQIDSLEACVDDVDSKSTVQIAIVTVDSLGNLSAKDFNVALFNSWGVGHKEDNKGIVMLYNPINEYGPGAIDIRLGYGLEDAIPDEIVSLIIDQEMIPHFKKGSVYEGIKAGLNYLIPLSLGVITADECSKEIELKQYEGKIPVVPNSPRLVNDYSGVFTPAQLDTLKALVDDVSNTSGTQIAIVTVDSLSGLSAREYAKAIHNTWGVGQKEKNNGIVILYKPFNEYGKGQIFISTGSGLEKAIPDEEVSRIIQEEMMPRLRVEDVYQATKNAVDELILHINQN